MKVTVLIILSVFLMSFSGDGLSGVKETVDSEAQTTVIICTGEHAKRYHRKKCRGMNACKGEAKEVSIDDAKKKKLTPCKICYK